MWAVVEIQTSRRCFTPTMGSSSASSTPSVRCGKLVDRLPRPPPLRVECWRIIWTSSWALHRQPALVMGRGNLGNARKKTGFLLWGVPLVCKSNGICFQERLIGYDSGKWGWTKFLAHDMRWSWQDEIDEFKILCTFLYKDWILFPGWKDGVSCIMHIRPPHQCQDVLHDQPDIPSPLVQCINKLFMFAIVATLRYSSFLEIQRVGCR